MATTTLLLQHRDVARCLPAQSHCDIGVRAVQNLFRQISFSSSSNNKSYQCVPLVCRPPAGREVPLDLVWFDFGAGVDGKLNDLLRVWWLVRWKPLIERLMLL